MDRITDYRKKSTPPEFSFKRLFCVLGLNNVTYYDLFHTAFMPFDRMIGSFLCESLDGWMDGYNELIIIIMFYLSETLL